LVIGQPAPTSEALGLGELLAVHEIPDTADNVQALVRLQITGPAIYLLRPDGHVGLAGTQLDPSAVGRYLADSGIFVPATARAAEMRDEAMA
jgi:hypothetical protein